MSFVSHQRVRFAHVDAAGIVFYPRYFEMLNVAVEEYFEQRHHTSFAQMHVERRIGVPTVQVEISFQAASRLGDDLQFRLTPVRVGRSSAEFTVVGRCNGEPRLAGKLVLVCTDLDRLCSIPWPSELRPDPEIEPAD